MEKNWKFSDIPYTHPDMQELQNRLDSLCGKLKAAKDMQTVKEVISGRDEINQEITVIQGVLYGRAFHDVTDEYYQTEFQTVLPQMAALDTESLSQAIVESSFGGEIDAAYGPEFRRLLSLDARLHSKGKEQQARAAELEAQYQQMKATLTFEVRGEKISGGKLSELLTSPDRALRKEAFEASHKSYMEKKDEFSAVLRELVQTRDAIAKANGFENYIEYATLSKSRLDYGHKELLAFCQDVQKYIAPIYRRLQEEQRERLGLEKLMPYDRGLVFPEGNAKPVSGETALAQAAYEMYHALSPEAGAFFDEMVAHEMLDVAGAEHKISGMGFCTDIPGEWKMPFIFANNNGTASDVTVYTHELGHGLQGYLSMRKQPLSEYFMGSPDLCEVHSKTMELYSYAYAPLFFGEQAEHFLQEHRFGIVKEFCSFCSTYLFESWLYTHVDASLEEWAKENNRIAKAFGMGLNNEEWEMDILAGYDLFNNMAIYMFPMYVVSYSLSEVCALQLKAAYEADPVEGWARYHALCEAGGGKSYSRIIGDAGLRLPYEPGVVEKTARQLEKLIWG